MKKTAEATKSKTEVWKILGTHSISSSVICSKSSIKRILEELTTGLPGKKHYSLAKQINSVLHCRGGNTKWLVLKPLFFFFPLCESCLLCLYFTLSAQMNGSSKSFQSCFLHFPVIFSCVRAHAHTHHSQKFFFLRKVQGYRNQSLRVERKGK